MLRWTLSVVADFFFTKPWLGPFGRRLRRIGMIPGGDPTDRRIVFFVPRCLRVCGRAYKIRMPWRMT